MVWLLLPGIIKTFFRTSIIELQAPSRQAASVVRDVQDYWALRSAGRNTLLRELSDLSRQNSYYQLRSQRIALLEEEIKRWEQLYNLPSHPEYHFEIARVVQRDSTTWWQEMTIRKGRQHGIRKGAPVVFAGGVVGRVREVHLATATVELLSSPGLRLSARISGEARPLGFQGGENRPFHPPGGRLDFIPADYQLPEGTEPLVVTTGLGGVFPEGLVIGRLTSLEESEETLFQAGRVRLDQRLHQIREVAVMIALEESTQASERE
ncbi:MAG: rod shape-determining protein MreC [Opitutales bacterium]|nr:rod shape-determining protein MreC [Opitutales bacterium]MCH8541016.1 rod shape-determining protein MreC [Opitutales bacterium]